MIIPTKKDIGREVTYWVKYGDTDVFDYGVLVGFSAMDRWVFIRYLNCETSKATRVENLHWGHYPARVRVCDVAQ